MKLNILFILSKSKLNKKGKCPIAKTCRGEQEQTGGYFWKYSD